jgi:hypothetical protein
MDIGDFSVLDRAIEAARDKQAERSSRSRGVDEEQRAPITTRANVWAENPDEYDFPGIDTPTENPRLLPKDLESREQGIADLTPQAAGRQGGGAEQIPSDEADRSMLASSDVTLGPNEAFEGEKTEYGFGVRRPSSTRLTEDAYQNLASGAEADMNFIEAEESRFDMGDNLFGSDG